MTDTSESPGLGLGSVSASGLTKLINYWKVSIIGHLLKVQTNNKICKIDYAKLLTYCKVYKIDYLLGSLQNCSIIKNCTKLLTYWKVYKIVHALETAQNCTLIGKFKKLLNYWKVHKIAQLLENITKLLT